MLAWTVAKMADPPTAPKQVRLAFGDGPEEMWVTWVSSSETQTPLVQYGTQPASKRPYPFLAKGTSATYAAEDFCSIPANNTAQGWFRDPGFMHSVLLTELSPNATRYYYSVGNDVDGWSEEFSFLSSRATESLNNVSNPDPIRFLALADHGVIFHDAVLTARNLIRESRRGGETSTADPYDAFVLLPGDVAYGTGVAWRWDAWGTLVQPLAANVPLMVGVGNHEYDHRISVHEVDVSGVSGEASWSPSWGDYARAPIGDSNGECGVAYAARFKTPSNGNGAFWYSFDHAYMHVVMMSSEHDYTRGSVQRAWLEKDLSSIDRAATRWVLVNFHRQMYTSQLPNSTEHVMAQHMRAELESLFLSAGVNLVLNGHQHSYERSCAVFNTSCVESGKAPVYLIIGTAGAPLGSGWLRRSMECGTHIPIRLPARRSQCHQHAC